MNDSPALFISYFTPAYASEAAGLVESCEAHGLDCYIRAVPDLGSWARNCGQKPSFIRRRMRDHPGQSIVWLDADARVRKKPVLFDTLQCDFAAHWRHGSELLSGTLYFSGSPASVRLVDAWCEVQAMEPDVWDQRNLATVIENRMVTPLVVEQLPAEYVAVWDDKKMGTEETWVISHHQASRRLAHLC